MIIGGHVSIAGGISKAPDRAYAQGFKAMQMFVSAPQSYRLFNHTEEDILLFKKLYTQHGFQGLFFHAIYLLNLASEKSQLVELSKQSLIDYMKIGERLECQGTIFHIGSYGDRAFDAVKAQLVEALKEVLEKSPDNQWLIMENAAGGGGRVGATIEELAYLYKQVDSPRLKVCIDTQHLFATGINVGNFEEFGEWLTDFDTQIGINNLVCLHVNDSKTELGSKKDRHENIGKGMIGIEGFTNVVRQPLLQGKIFILEVPGVGEGPDRANAELLMSLAKLS